LDENPHERCNEENTTFNLVEWLAEKYRVPIPIIRYYEDYPHWIPEDGVEGYHVPKLPILHISTHAEDPELVLCHEFQHYFLDTLGSKNSVMEKTLAVEDLAQREAELDLEEFRAAIC